MASSDGHASTQAVLLVPCSPGTVLSAPLAAGPALPPNNPTLPGLDQRLIAAHRAPSCFQGLGPCWEPPALHTRVPQTTRAWVQNLSLSPALVHIQVSLVPPGPPGSLPQDRVTLPRADGYDGTRPGEGRLGSCLEPVKGSVAAGLTPHQDCQRLLLADHGSSLRGT